MRPLESQSRAARARRIEMPLEADLHQPIRAVAKPSAEVGRFGNRVGERFLDEHRRAGADEGQTVARVVPGARRDDHTVQARRRHGLRRVEPCDPRQIQPTELVQQTGRRRQRRREPIAHRDELDPASLMQRDQVLEVHLAHAADAKRPKSQPLPIHVERA